ncbi:hypothetical protein STRDD10_01622 [Streptococcus sp. DD10]|nr:hypothetical protein [Streptococcus sp. DD10]KXT73147.1 hypothetical protein STRDD10_01622 [Streptococcus sp. DD10]
MKTKCEREYNQLWERVSLAERDEILDSFLYGERWAWVKKVQEVKARNA